jgi:agmatine deiminase
VILPAFGDERDDAAAHALVSKLHPDREAVQLRIDSLGEGGGGIHCATQQQPAV